MMLRTVLELQGARGPGTISSKKGPLRCREKVVGLKGAGFSPPPPSLVRMSSVFSAYYTYL